MLQVLHSVLFGIKPFSSFITFFELFFPLLCGTICWNIKLHCVLCVIYDHSIISDFLLKHLCSRCVHKLNCFNILDSSTFTEGAIRGLFDHKGFIEAIPPEKTSLETSVEHAIEAGAEDVVELEDAEDNVLQVHIPLQ
jgi:hypothetical protein